MKLSSSSVFHLEAKGKPSNAGLQIPRQPLFVKYQKYIITITNTKTNTKAAKIKQGAEDNVLLLYAAKYYNLITIK